jgi:hypothetical protein
MIDSKFEEFAKDRGLNTEKLCHGDYKLFVTGEAYAAWQAASAQDGDKMARLMTLEDEMKARVAELEASAVVPEWISVKDRLPLKPSADIVFEQQEYLVTDGVIVGVCDFQRGNGAGNPWASWGMYGYGGLPRQSITHWMELPQPPNQEKDTLN